MPRLDTLAFESEFQYMPLFIGTWTSGDSDCDQVDNVVYVKGAVERLSIGRLSRPMGPARRSC
jgi:hypothetical protein